MVNNFNGTFNISDLFSVAKIFSGVLMAVFTWMLNRVVKSYDELQKTVQIHEKRITRNETQIEDMEKYSAQKT